MAENSAPYLIGGAVGFIAVLWVVIALYEQYEKYIFLKKRRSREIKARVISFSGCNDNQHSKGLKNVEKVYTHQAWKDNKPGVLQQRSKRNKLASIKKSSSYFTVQKAYEQKNETSGGLFTSTLLEELYNLDEQPNDTLTYQLMLLKIQKKLIALQYEQIPHIATSHPIKFNQATFRLFPVDHDFKETAHKSDAHVHNAPVAAAVNNDNNGSRFNGTKRAVLIGISYEGKLCGTQNDVWNVREFLKKIHGFEDQNITIVVDDGKHTSPTGDNIRAAYKKITAESKAGDYAFCHYSGHGGRLADDNGDELDGFDETLIPLDFELNGHIRDDEVYEILVEPMAEGVILTTIFDSCHSGSVMDLPYEYTYQGESNPANLGA